jgi:hypothetical protein
MSSRKDAWTEADKAYLVSQLDTLSNVQIAEHLGRTLSGVQSMASLMGLKRSSQALSRILVETWKSREGTWSETERQYLIDNWQTSTKREMADHLGRSMSAVKSMGTKQMGLAKTSQARKTIQGRMGHNGGTFKKGDLPYNTIHGDELVVRVRKNRNGPSYKWIRVSFKQWKEYHVWVWEQANGAVPDGQMINFANNDQMDCRIENLFLTTRAQHAVRHSASMNLTDNYIAHTLTRDKELKTEVLNYPELIDLQRTNIQLNRILKNHGKVTGN